MNGDKVWSCFIFYLLLDYRHPKRDIVLYIYIYILYNLIITITPRKKTFATVMTFQLSRFDRDRIFCPG